MFSDRIMTVSESFEEYYLFLAINVDVQVFCEVKLVDETCSSVICLVNLVRDQKHGRSSIRQSNET